MAGVDRPGVKNEMKSESKILKNEMKSWKEKLNWKLISLDLARI